MIDLSWDQVRNKPSQCVEFAAVHDNFAWRKHHASKFGLLKNQQTRCADDSLSRAFTSKEDSLICLFSEVGNRTLRDHPEYGHPRYAVVWYKDEDWAILCTQNEAVLIKSSKIANYSCQREGADERLIIVRGIWNSSEHSLRVPMSQVSEHIT